MVGTFTDKPDEIETILSCHFMENYGNRSNINVEDLVKELQALPIPTLSDQDCNLLNRPISSMEVEDTVFQLGPHKAFSSDGIPAFFFHELWPIVKTDVISIVQAFFHSGSLFKPLNHIFITLIPKVTYPEEVNHFRPISLSNVIYKVISKILVNRLKPLMDTLITPYQNAFIWGRNVSDNILLAHEILDVLRKKRGKKYSFGALKIDMIKACDKVRWNFLHAVLIVMKFDSKQIKWIMECVTSVHYTLLINGNLTKSFTPAQGLRSPTI